MSETLLSPTFLFRFSVPCVRNDFTWTKQGIDLPDSATLPSFAEMEGQKIFAEVRAAWNENGLGIIARVTGKKQTPWCRSTRIDESDGLQLWIDTRDTHNIHRASRFCHRFAFLPAGGGRKMNEPIAELLSINRARDVPKPITPGSLKIMSEKRIDGYVLKAFIPARTLTGFDPTEHRRMGFFYAVVDRELGTQTLSVGSEFPFDEDPSLWGTLELTDAASVNAD